MKFVYRVSADTIWLFHLLVLLVALFGWLIPGIWPVYLLVLVGILLSELALSYCFLSKWEFDLRKKLCPHLDYDYSYTSYYTYKLTHQRISTRFIARTGMLFTSLSIILTLFFKFGY